jgi:hypothetical protein
MTDWITERTKDPHVFVDLSPEDELERRQAEEMIGAESTVGTECKEMMEDVIYDLSADAQELLSLLLDTPAEILSGMRPTPKQLLNRVKKFLLASGRDACKLESAYRELKVCFRWAWAT